METQHLFFVQDKIYTRIARMIATLGAPARLMLVHMLSQGPKSVELLSKMTRQTFANTSQHLQRMAKEGLVDVEKHGVKRVYRLRTPALLPIWEDLQDLAHIIDPSLDKDEEKLGNRAYGTGIPVQQIKKEISSGWAILLDVRSEKEAEATPIPKALNIPTYNLKTDVKKLDRKKLIYVICRGRYCAAATMAVELLRKKGFKSFRLKESPFRFLRLETIKK